MQTYLQAESTMYRFIQKITYCCYFYLPPTTTFKEISDKHNEYKKLSQEKYYLQIKRESTETSISIHFSF